MKGQCVGVKRLGHITVNHTDFVNLPGQCLVVLCCVMFNDAPVMEKKTQKQKALSIFFFFFKHNNNKAAWLALSKAVTKKKFTIALRSS